MATGDHRIARNGKKNRNYILSYFKQSRIREKGLFDKKTAESFRKNILEKGKTEDPMKMYKDFRGAEPSIEPLLKKRGLK